jgi:hypothetical protein
LAENLTLKGTSSAKKKDGGPHAGNRTENEGGTPSLMQPLLRNSQRKVKNYERETESSSARKRESREGSPKVVQASRA